MFPHRSYIHGNLFRSYLDDAKTNKGVERFSHANDENAADDSSTADDDAIQHGDDINGCRIGEDAKLHKFKRIDIARRYFDPGRVHVERGQET